MKKKGVALIVVIVVIAVLMILSASLIDRTTSSFKVTTSDDSINRVNMMAESGIELALNKIKVIGTLKNDIAMNSTSEDNAINLTVNIYASSSTIISTAIKSNGNYSKTITVTLNKPITNTTSQVNTAVFAISSLNLTGSANITGDVGTNSLNANAISYSNSNMFTGKVYILPNGNPDTIVIGPTWTPRPTIGILDSIKSYPVPVLVLSSFPQNLPTKNDINLGQL